MDEFSNFDDDITDSMTDEDLQQLENDAWRKIGAVEDNLVGESKKITNDGNKTRLDLTRNTSATTNRAGSYPPVTTQRSRETNAATKAQLQASNITSQQSQDLQLQQLASQLHDYKMKVEKMETTLRTKDGELRVVRKNLDASRKEVSVKAQLISKMKQEQEQERSERNSKQAQEIKMLKTQLSFQKHELMKQEFDKHQSQNVSSSQKVSINSQKVSGSVKRKAEFPSASLGFGLDNSFHDSQAPDVKVGQQGKVPRLERSNQDVTVEKKLGKQIESEAKNTNIPCRPSTSKMVESNETKSSLLPKSNPHLAKTPAESSTCPPSTTKNDILQLRIASQSEKKLCNLAKKLVLSYSSDSLVDGNQYLEPISLLTLLKYPLKHIPEILQAHAVGKKLDQSLSQFPILHTQLQDPLLSSDKTLADEEIDFDSGKYNLVSQGMFLLLGLPHDEKNVDTLGVFHVLVLLELYISSYVMTRQKKIEAGIGQKNVQGRRNSPQAGNTAGESTDESEAQKTFHDEQDMIKETLQLLRLLFYSAPGLVKCVLDRTNPELFQEHSTDEDLVITFDSAVDVKDNLKEMKDKDQVFEENAVGSFRSLLLENLQKLVNPTSNDGLFLPVSHAALEVLVAMTSLCDYADLERMFVSIKHLVELLGKEECTISTVSLVISVIRNFLPFKDVHKLLCSGTDDCILLKMYQCACDEEDEKAEDCFNTFLLQFFQLLMDVTFSHADSLEFLLESDCQCSFEIVRCLVLVLHDKVDYLLDLDVEKVILDESLPVVRAGINILVVLCTHGCFSPGHKLHVEHKFSELIYKSMTLFKRLRRYMPELEGLALQDLLDMEDVEEIEWFSGSETEDNETKMSQ